MQIIDIYLEEIQTPQNEIATVLIAAGALAGILNAINMSVKLYKEKKKKNKRRCADLPDKERDVCLMQLKILAKSKQENKVKELLSKCSKTKDQTKCKQKAFSKLKEIQQDKNMFKQRLSKISK